MTKYKTKKGAQKARKKLGKGCKVVRVDATKKYKAHYKVKCDR